MAADVGFVAAGLQFAGEDFDANQRAPTAGGQVLAHAVPVIEHIDTRWDGGQQHGNHQSFIVGGGKGQVIRLGQAGGIPFLAVQTVAVTGASQPRKDGAQRRAVLCMSPGEQLAVEDLADVIALLGAVRAIDHRFAEVEIRTQIFGDDFRNASWFADTRFQALDIRQLECLVVLVGEINGKFMYLSAHAFR